MVLVMCTPAITIAATADSQYQTAMNERSNMYTAGETSSIAKQ